jgi:nitrate reductase NapAB chaperone NapD
MPVFSYLAYPEPGKKEELFSDLAALDHCEPTPAENQEVILLVTDTPDETTEQKLQEQLKQVKTLQSLGMTFAHIDE